MAQERTFTLIGNFTDNITPNLKKVTKSLREMEDLLKSLSELTSKKGKNAFAEGFKSAQEEAKTLGKVIEGVAKKGFDFDRSGIKAAIEDVKVLDKEIEGVSKKGFDFDASGIKSAQKEASVLGEILKANALIQIGEGVSAAGSAGLAAVGRGVSATARFIVSRFQEAAADQLEDIQARGSLFGSLSKEGMFANAKDVKDAEKLRDINDDNYDITKSISRSMEGAIADVVKSSTVSTETITVLSRQLSDNLLPSLLKAKGVTDLSKFGGPQGRAELEKIMGGKTGVGTQLATLYEQIGSIIPSSSYAPMAAAGFTQFLGTGKIDKSLSIFQSNPVLVSALEAGLKKHENTIEGRITALTEGLQVAMPEAALMEARTTIAGGFQSISDSLTNASAGILSMGADVTNQGQKTLEMAKRSGAYQLEIDTYKKREGERLKTWLAQGTRSEEEIANYKARQAKDFKTFTKNLTRLYESADSPIEVISVTFGPLMQSFADLIGSAGNLFIGPVVAIMEELQAPLTQLRENLKNLASDVRAGKPLAEAVGEAIGNFFKAIATLFKPEGVAKKGGDAIQKAFDDFRKGFESVDGAKFMKIVMDGLTSLIMKAIFNEGNVLKGLTPLGDGLIKIFALMAAPAFISALISGLVPVAVWSMGKMTSAIFSKLTEKAVQWFTSAKPIKPVVVKDVTAASKFTPYGLLPPAKSVAPALPAAKGAGGGKLSTLKKLPNVLPKITESFIKFHENIRAGKTGFGSTTGFMPLKSLTTNFTKFGELLGKGVRGLGKFGTILTAVIAIFDLVTNLAAGKDLASSLGAAAGPAFGTILGFALGGPIGAMIGGWLGGQKPVIDFFTGTFQALGDFMSFVGPSIMSTLESLGSVFQSLWNVTFGLIPIFRDTSGASGALSAGFYLVKGVLLPVAGAFYLLELACLGLKLAFLMFDQWLNNTFQGGSRSGRLADEIDKTVTSINAANKRMLDLAAATPKTPSKGNTPAGPPPAQDITRATPAGPPPPVATQVIVPPVLKQGIPTIAARAAEQIAATNSVGATAKASNSSLTNIKTSSAPVPGKLDSIKSALMVISNKLDSVVKMASTLDSIKSALMVISSKMDNLQKTMTSGSMKVKFMIGGGPSGGPGSVDAFNPIAAAHGLQITSGYRPGDPGYHGIDRARDYSNSTGPTRQMLEFATFMAAAFGGSLAELIYTPLGFSIKDGQVVAPYAQAGHYNHVHVAYGLGTGSPAFFASPSEARAWEAKMAPKYASIATVTSNSSEGFGGPVTISAPIQIYQQPFQDSEELAVMVANHIGMAVDELRNHR